MYFIQSYFSENNIPNKKYLQLIENSTWIFTAILIVLCIDRFDTSLHHNQLLQQSIILKWRELILHRLLQIYELLRIVSIVLLQEYIQVCIKLIKRLPKFTHNVDLVERTHIVRGWR